MSQILSDSAFNTQNIDKASLQSSVSKTIKDNKKLNQKKEFNQFFNQKNENSKPLLKENSSQQPSKNSPKKLHNINEKKDATKQLEDKAINLSNHIIQEQEDPESLPLTYNEDQFFFEQTEDTLDNNDQTIYNTDPQLMITHENIPLKNSSDKDVNLAFDNEDIMETENVLDNISTMDTKQTDIMVKTNPNIIEFDGMEMLESSSNINLEVSPQLTLVESFYTTDNKALASHNVIQIQKPELINQIPLGNDLQLNIVKDTTNSNKISINLEPAGMGEVELVIENNRDNSVIAVIRTDKPEILEQLRKETASLERYLAEAGLDLGQNGLNFQQKSQNEQNNHSQNDTHLSASILQEPTEILSSLDEMTNQQKLYLKLDGQTMQTGIDIRL